MSEQLTIEVARKTYDPLWKIQEAVDTFLSDKVSGKDRDVIITVTVQVVDKVIS